MVKKRRGSSGALSMTAEAAPKQDPYKYTRDGKKQKVEGQANVPTARQKQGALELALSGVGGPIVGKLIGKAAPAATRALAKRAASKAPSNVVNRATPNTATSPTSAPMPKPTPKPKVNKAATPKTPKTPKPTNGKPMPKRVVDIVKTAAGRGTPGRRSRVDQTVSKLEEKVGLGKQGQRRGVSKRDQNIANNVRTGAKVAGTAALIGGGAKLYDSIDPLPTNKKQTQTKNNATSNPPSNPPRSRPRLSPPAGAMEELEISPGGENQPKASKKAPKKDKTEGGDYKSYSKDNNDFMYMTQQGYDKQEMEDMGGEKFGGRPGRGKLKTQGMNKTAKRKAGFSGKGSGAALRGF